MRVGKGSGVGRSAHGLHGHSRTYLPRVPVPGSIPPLSDSAEPGPAQPRRFAFVACAALLLAGVWLIAGLFLLGDLGYWNDDFFIAQRDPATGERSGWALPAATPFQPPRDGIVYWRPALTVGMATLMGELWNTPRVLFAIMALVHGAVGVALWALLRRLGRSPAVSVGAACLYVAFPAHFEVWMWASAASASLGVLALLGIIALWLRWTRDDAGLLGDARTLLGLALLAALATCSYEQAAAGVAALPLLSLARAPAHGTLRRAVLRCGLGLAVIGMVYAIYLGLILAHRGPDGSLGASGAIQPMAMWGRSMLRILEGALFPMGLGFQGAAAWRVGAETMFAAHALRAWACVGLVVASLAGLIAWTRTTPGLSRWAAAESFAGTRAGGQAPFSRVQRFWLAVFGGVLAVASLIPVAMVGGAGALRPRLVAVVCIGVLILLATCADRATQAIGPRPRAQRAWWVGLMLAWCGAMVYCLPASVGMQRGFQARAQLDADTAQRLRELIPSPAPRSVFVPVLVDSLPIRTDTHAYSTYYIGPLYWGFAFPFYIQDVYRRSDVDAAAFSFDFHPVLDAHPDGLLLPGPLKHGFVPDPLPASLRVRQPQQAFVAWDRIVPIWVIDRDVRVVTELTFTRGGAEVLRVRPPAVGGLGVPEFAWTVELPE